MASESDFYDELLGPVSVKGARTAQPKAKKRRNNPEDVMHVALNKMLRQSIGEAGTTSPEGVYWASVEHRNAGKTITTKSGKKINLEGINRKARGVRPFPDTFYVYRGQFHVIELKVVGGVVSDDQKAMLRAMDAAGALCGVAWSIQQAFEFLAAWRIPHRKVTF